MGTREYLEGLTLDQLEYARDVADELIAGKRKEQKLVVWRVVDTHSVIELFSDADYVKAAERLLAEARGNAASPQNLSPKRKALHLVPEYVPVSEYAELGLGIGVPDSGPTAGNSEDQNGAAPRPSTGL